MKGIPRILFLRRLGLVLACIFAGLLGSTLALAYAEEPLSFIDPFTQQEVPGQEINTIHFDLQYALSLAAGFSVSDSIRMQLWDQLVDSERLGTTPPYSYTNCAGSFPTPPEPGDVCPAGANTRQVLWPDWGKVGDQCTTSRFGPYSPFFHFPRQSPEELGALKDWGWGSSPTLSGYEAYAWGPPLAVTILDASCSYTRTSLIDTGIQAGSLEAFATYLHTLGDSWSHLLCIQAIDSGKVDAPWGTHTANTSAVPPYDPCGYIPAKPENYDAHGREYGSLWITDSNRTMTGILAIYVELAQRARVREGQYSPLSLDAPLSGVEPASTLREAVDRFVHEWGFQSADEPVNQFAVERRSYARQIAQAVLAQQLLIQRSYLPLVQK
jgi:hypothetical protein